MDLLHIDEIIRDSEALSFVVKSESKTPFVGELDEDYSEAWLYKELVRIRCQSFILNESYRSTCDSRIVDQIAVFREMIAGFSQIFEP